jgi:hypothetical protein
MHDSELVEVYSAQDDVQAHGLANLLEQEGIRARVVDAANGQLPMGEPWNPRIWVFREDEPRAREIILAFEETRTAQLKDPLPVAPAWICPACGSEVDGDCEVCWNCGHSREEETPPS